MQTDFAALTGINIEVRPTQISQVLLNLLSNAIDAVEKSNEKWIELRGFTRDHSVFITVTDSGKGIPPVVASRLMEPFFTTKEVGKGTGLGLSISKRIIEEYRGQLYYDTSSPQTRFVIELPISYHQVNDQYSKKRRPA